MNLTPDQLIAYQDILIFFNQTFGGFHLLKGFAGTGKTFLSVRIVDELATDINNKILITAPTHKALQVLQKESKLNYLNVDFATIHSALGLIESVDGYGNQTFKPDPKQPKPKITKYKLILVDEVSMLHDSLFFYLLPHLKRRSLKILFIGDPAQIPPVKKLDSLPLQSEQQTKYKIGVSTLTQIVRQTENNPIIGKTLEIRNNLQSPNVFVNRVSEETPFGNVKFLQSMNKNDQTEFIKILSDLFTSPKFQKDPDIAKIIAWRNDTVNIMNDIIREMIYGSKSRTTQLPKILPTEKLIMDGPIFEKNKVLLATNDEVTVLKYEIKQVTTPFFVQPIKIYVTEVEKKTLDNKFAKLEIRILHEDSAPMFNKKLAQHHREAKTKFAQGSFQARQLWRKYYDLKNHFAAIKYNYCITAHKSQGSTYENAIVLNYDLDANPNIVERNRIKYTACTRPKNNLFIIV